MTHIVHPKQVSKVHTHVSNYEKTLMSVFSKKKSWAYLFGNKKKQLPRTKV